MLPRVQMANVAKASIHDRIRSLEANAAAHAASPSAAASSKTKAVGSKPLFEGWLIKCGVSADLKRYCVLYPDPMLHLYEDERMTTVKNTIVLDAGTKMEYRGEVLTLSSLPKVGRKTQDNVKFKAGTPQLARKWLAVLREAAGEQPADPPEPSAPAPAVAPVGASPASPAAGRQRCDSVKFLEATVGSDWGAVQRPSGVGAGAVRPRPSRILAHDCIHCEVPAQRSLSRICVPSSHAPSSTHRPSVSDSSSAPQPSHLWPLT